MNFKEFLRYEEEEDYDDSDIDLSDSLKNRQCTCLQTKKNYIYQQNFRCFDCYTNLKGSAICSVCIDVCHKNHDTEFLSYTSCFCDCV
jgi:hypothetical protein